jgi:hypothetical protein
MQSNFLKSVSKIDVFNHELFQVMIIVLFFLHYCYEQLLVKLSFPRRKADMKNVLEHKGYSGSVEFSADDDVFFGKINRIRDVVTFEADSVVKLKKAFKDAVEDYIDLCKGTK